jgi:phage gp29-like protein
VRKTSALATNKPQPAYEKRPDGSARLRDQIVQPLSTRSLLSDWTPAKVADAIRAAEAGNLEQACMLCLALMRDDRVTAALSPRVEGLLGLPLSWEGEEPVGWYVLAGEPELAKLLRWGIILGRGFARVLPNGALETWSPEFFRYDRYEAQWWVRTRDGEIPIEFGKGDWISYAPYGELDGHLWGLWLTIALPWLVKRYSLHDRARASEVFGSAMIIGKVPEGATEEMRVKWLADLRALARNSRIVLPDTDYSLDLLEAQGQTWGIYQQAIEWADTAITVSIAGQTVTVEGTTGFARGDVHERVARSLLKYTAESAATCLHAQYVRPVWGLDSYPKWVTASPDELIGEGAAYTALAGGIEAINAQLAGDNVRVDVQLLVRKYGIPVIAIESSVTAPSFVLAPTDASAAITLDEARLALGLTSPPAPGAKMFAQFKAEQEAGVAGSPALPGAPALPQPSEVQANADPHDSIKLADDMTRLSIERCRHRRSNSCPSCHIRRRNEVSADGTFPLIWEPVIASTVPSGAKVTKPATSFRIFVYGGNLTDHRPSYLTREHAASIVRSFTGRDVMIDLEHLSIDPEAEEYDPDARGWARLEQRNDGLWAVNVRWSPDGVDRITNEKQLYISPYYDVTAAGVIVRLTNLALTALPAMYFPPRVAA